MRTENYFKTSNNNCYYFSEKRKELIFTKESLFASELDKTEDQDYYKIKLEYLKTFLFFDEYNKNIKVIDKSLILLKLNSVKTLTFGITEQCNLNCTYCGYGKYYNGYEPRQDRNLSVEVAKQFLNRLLHLRKKEKHLLISFYGGEPLINFNFIESITNFINENFSDYNIEFTMTTNGVLIKKHLEFLIRNKFDLYISLDGDKASNEFRKFKNAKKSFDLVFENLLFIKQNFNGFFKNNVGIISVLHSKNNRKDVIDFCIKELGKYPITGDVNLTGLNTKFKNEFKKEIASQNQVQIEPKHKVLNNVWWEKLISYSDLLNIESKDYIPEYFYSATCIPFDSKLFISTTQKILPCEKIDHCYRFGEISIESIDINIDKILQKYLEIQTLQENICKQCYVGECTYCIYNTTILKEGYCSEFISKKQYTEEYNETLTKIENNER